MVMNNIKGYYISNNTFHVLKESENKTKDVYIQGLLLPRDEVSRNGVLYDWESIKEKHKDLIGKPMLFNHDTEVTDRPLGTFVDSWLKENDDNEGKAGWYYKARLNPRSQYYEDVIEGYVNKVSIQVNAEKVVPEYKGSEEYKRAYIGDILEASGVNVPGFNQTSIETLIAEAFKKEKRLKEDHVEKGIFPTDEFEMGISIEKEEHPNLNILEIGQLVLDHLKNSEYYYSSKNNDEENKTEEINTVTAVGAVQPTKMIDNDSDKEEDKMSKIVKKEELQKTPEEEVTKVEEAVEDDEEVVDNSVLKEEYADDMTKVVEALETLKNDNLALREELDSIKAKLPQDEEVQATENVEEDKEVISESEDTENEVVPDQKTDKVIEESEDSEEDKNLEESEDVEVEEEEEVEEPIPPITEKSKLNKSLKERATKSEMTLSEALSGFVKERLKI